MAVHKFNSDQWAKRKAARDEIKGNSAGNNTAELKKRVEQIEAVVGLKSAK
jgi:hypothetical protein